MMWAERIVLSVIGLVLSALLTTTGALAQPYEKQTTMSASDILPPSLLRGKHFKVRDRVLAYDFLHHFTVESDFGLFEVTGDGALGKLVHEIAAIGVLKKISTADAVGESMVQAAESPFVLAKNLITHPVSTVSGLPKGISRLLGNVSERLSMEHDLAQDTKLKEALFVSSWKRDFASDNGVDVYSSNKVLQKELNRLGWAGAMTGLGISVATLGAGTTVTVMKNMRLANQVTNALKEESPARLHIINEQKLQEMGVSAGVTARFLDHLAYTPRHDTIIVACLAQMPSTDGREAFLEHILLAKDEVGANFFQQMAETMLSYHTTVSPLVEITIVDRMVVIQAHSGITFVPFPLDRGVWTAQAEQIFENITSNRLDAGFTGKIDLWITGTISPLAQQNLGSCGVTVTQQVDDLIGFLN